MCERVLVIDGDPAIRKFLCDLIAFLGVEVVTVTDGEGPPATTLAPRLAS